ncbi:MAG: cytochrome c maturation protein CcmE [Actinomycetota bacterium]
MSDELDDLVDGDLSDEPPLDLTPRDVDATAARSRRRLVPMLIVAVAMIGIGVVLFQTLSSASFFFYNADEAIERRDELVDQRFRLQGLPFGDTAEVELLDGSRTDVGVVFAVCFEQAIVDVVHVGAPAELFQPGVPVVLEGQWVAGRPGGIAVPGGADDGWHFASTDMVVKHDNEYRNDNRDRLDEAADGGAGDTC